MRKTELTALLEPVNAVESYAEEHFLEASRDRHNGGACVDNIEDALESDSDELDAKLWIQTIREFPWIHKPAPLKITIALFLVGFATGMEGPLKQVILYKLACQSLTDPSSSSNICDLNQVQTIVTNFSMWDSIVQATALMLTTAQVCRMLDIYGRRIFVIFFTFCFLCGQSIVYLAMSNSGGMPVWWMWFGTAVSMCVGGNPGITAICKAYIIDVAPPSERIYYIGFAMVGISIGGILGPLGSSALLEMARKHEQMSQNPLVQNMVPRLELVPLQGALAVLGLLFVYTVMFLGESRSPALRKKARAMSQTVSTPEKSGNPVLRVLRLYVRPLRILTYSDEFRTPENTHRFGKDRAIVVGLAVFEAVCLVFLLSPLLLVPQYCIYKFHWDSVTLSYSMFLLGLATTLVLVFVSPFIFNHVFPRLGIAVNTKAFDAADSAVILLSLLCYGFCLAGQAAATNTPTMIVFTVALQSWNILPPTITAAIVKYFPTSKTGELYGAISLTQSITSLVVPAALSRTFVLGIRLGHPELFLYVLMGLVSALAVLAAVMTRLARGG